MNERGTRSRSVNYTGNKLLNLNATVCLYKELYKIENGYNLTFYPVPDSGEV